MRPTNYGIGHAERMCRLIGVVLTGMEVDACRYLERFGYRFAVDFGYQSAVAKAADHYVNTLQIFGTH